jgi:hypothetical protein
MFRERSRLCLGKLKGFGEAMRTRKQLKQQLPHSWLELKHHQLGISLRLKREMKQISLLKNGTGEYLLWHV